MSDMDPRPGEIAIDLPAEYDAGIYFIGRICTPWKTRRDCPKNPSESTAECIIEIDARYADGLKGLETATHLFVLYFMDQAPRNLVLQAPRHYNETRGTFALRSPARPNPIALSVARLLRVEGTRLHVVGLDCIDGTPLVDLKPYFASIDSVPQAEVGWHKARGQE